MIDPHTLVTGKVEGADDTTWAAPFEHFLRDAEARRATRALFDGELLRCSPGWPRMVEGSQVGHWLRPSDVLVELAHEPARSAFELAIALHAESATRLVERILGAPESSGTASSVGGPSEAECGVLAYAAARLCASAQGSLRVRAVRRDDPRPLLAELPALLVWPVAWASSFGPLQGALWLSAARAAQSSWRASASLLVRDDGDADGLSALAPGDLLLSDAWTLTATSDGIAGDVFLSVAGLDGVWSARLANGVLTARSIVEQSDANQLELVLTRRELALPTLARFAAGEPLPLAPSAGESAILRVRGVDRARGELVVRNGALGLRVDALLVR